MDGISKRLKRKGTIRYFVGHFHRKRHRNLKNVVPSAQHMTRRDRLWHALEDPKSTRAYVFSIIILLLILLSSTVFILETTPSLCCGRYDHIWSPIEWVCVSVFTFEYLLRIATVPISTDNTGWFALLPEAKP